jgi:hypothetical protein
MGLSSAVSTSFAELAIPSSCSNPPEPGEIKLSHDQIAWSADRRGSS